MTTSDTTLSMKLLIDTKAGKVLFAEAEKNCVDFLFHILSLPVASVVRLLKEKGMNYGCLPNLYDSVENLNDTYIQSNQAKDMLLKPNSSIGISSVPLQLVNDVPTIQRIIYGRPSRCSSYTTEYPYTNCPKCGDTLSRRVTNVAQPTATKGFVKELVTYMVMDDLVVTPMSTISSITLLNKFNVKDVAILHQEVVHFGMEEALKLLKASFESKTVLTSVFMSHIKVEK